MGAPITFVTPSFAGDYEWFVFQRESMARCGIDVQHIVVVDTEDVELFRKTPFNDRLVVVSTRDVLPAEIEERRRDGEISGWWLQQLVKLAAAEIVDNDYACVDSDVFWVRSVTAADFHAPSGALYVLEDPWMSTEMLGWLAASLKFWGVGPHQQVLPVSYVVPVVPLARSLTLDLLTEIEERCETGWHDALLEHGGVEYTMYGVYARYVRRLEGLLPTEARYCIVYTDPELERFKTLFSEDVSSRDAKAGMLHLHTPLAPADVRGVVERAWRDGGYKSAD